MSTSENLTKILEEELEILQSMKKQEEQLHTVLLEGSAQSLPEINQTRNELLTKLQELEEKRQDLVGEEITLKEYIARENPPQKSALLDLRKQLRDLNNSLKRLQKINWNLLRYNLKHVRRIRQVLMPEGENISYAPSGDLRYDGSSSAVLDDDA